MIEIEAIQEQTIKPLSDGISEKQSNLSQVQPVPEIQEMRSQPFPMLLYPFLEIIVSILQDQLIVSIVLIANYTDFSSSFIDYYYDTSNQEALIGEYCYYILPYRYPTQAQIDKCIQQQMKSPYHNDEYYTEDERLMTKTQPLFIASFIMSAITYFIVSYLEIQNVQFKKIASLIFTAFQTLLIVGFCLVSQYYLNEWNMWSCIILIFVTYGTFNICKRCNLSDCIFTYNLEKLAIVCIVFPQIALLCYGQAGFKIESVAIASLYSINALYWINEKAMSTSPWLNSQPVSGIFFQNLLSSIKIFLINPCQTILRFAYKDQNKVKNTSQEQKRIHLIQTYTIVIIIIGMSLFMVGLAQYTNVYTIYGKIVFSVINDTGSYPDYDKVFKKNPLTLVCYIIVPCSHFISMLIYPKSGQNLILYILSQILFRLEIIFIPLLFGSLSITEVFEYKTDNYCVEYSLFFTGLGVIALLGYSIGNTQHNEDKQLKYVSILPVSSLIMIIYQMDYISIGIGFTAGLLFTFYIHYQSNFIINNKISQVYMDDPIVSAAQCMNPVQLVNDFIQYFRDRRSSNSIPTQI